jgi:hypothetical protein
MAVLPSCLLSYDSVLALVVLELWTNNFRAEML